MSEHSEQTEFIRWCRRPDILLVYPDLEAIFAIPNGGKRSRRAGGQMKKEGAQAGVWDVHLPVPIPGWWSGLWLEFKFGDGGLSEEQKRWGDLMRRCGHQCEVVYSRVEAQRITEEYLR